MIGRRRPLQDSASSAVSLARMFLSMQRIRAAFFLPPLLAKSYMLRIISMENRPGSSYNKKYYHSFNNIGDIKNPDLDQLHDHVERCRAEQHPGLVPPSQDALLQEAADELGPGADAGLGPQPGEHREEAGVGVVQQLLLAPVAVEEE